MKNIVKINFHPITLQEIVDHIIQTQIEVLLKIEEILITITHIQDLILSTHLLKLMIIGKRKLTKWTIAKVTHIQVRIKAMTKIKSIVAIIWNKVMAIQ